MRLGAVEVVKRGAARYDFSSTWWAASCSATRQQRRVRALISSNGSVARGPASPTPGAIPRCRPRQ
jgi:hypothetical protein